MEKAVIVTLGGRPLRCFRLDMLVDEVLVVERKAKHRFHKEDFQQTPSYLAATGYHLALALNVDAPMMEQGIKRVIRSRSATGLE
ncbi:MAG TPA: GxxExxY protein [Candidatus Thermoplasmatota archaeon]|nr:GxxExxY protein [Candidatus Thermoplasmatota archaeon]